MNLRLKAYLAALLTLTSGVVYTPELPAMDKVEMISKAEKRVTLVNCEDWARKSGNARYKVRATMSDRSSGTIWNNNCVFNLKVVQRRR